MNTATNRGMLGKGPTPAKGARPVLDGKGGGSNCGSGRGCARHEGRKKSTAFINDEGSGDSPMSTGFNFFSHSRVKAMPAKIKGEGCIEELEKAAEELGSS